MSFEKYKILDSQSILAILNFRGECITMVDFEKMSTPELEKKLIERKEFLKEVEEERMFTLSQTGLHLPGTTVKKYEDEIEEINQSITILESLLQKRY